VGDVAADSEIVLLKAKAINPGPEIGQSVRGVGHGEEIFMSSLFMGS
jgi:hypothetical protein